MPLPFDALYYAEKVVMETWVSLAAGLRNLRMKCCAQQGSLADGDDSSVVERCQHFYFWANLFNGWATDEEGVEWRFSQGRHGQISLKTFPLTAKCITANADIHGGQ